MANDGVVAQNGMLALLQVTDADNHQGRQEQDPQETGLSNHQLQCRQNPQQNNDKERQEAQRQALINPIQHLGSPSEIDARRVGNSIV